jgi:hypothetical protein
VSCYRLIDAEKASYSVSLLCRVLRVSRSGYYDCKDRTPSKRERENADLTERIREIHQRSRETYGYPRVHAERERALGVVHCKRKRVARLRRKDGLRGCMRGRRRKHTTRQDLLSLFVPRTLWRGTSSPLRPIGCGGRTLHICPRMRRLPLPGLHPRRLFPPAGGGLVDGKPSAQRTGSGCS